MSKEKQQSPAHTYVLGSGYIDDQVGLAISKIGAVEDVANQQELQQNIISSLAAQGYQFYLPLRVTDAEIEEHDKNKEAIKQVALKIVSNNKSIESKEASIANLKGTKESILTAITSLDPLEKANIMASEAFNISAAHLREMELQMSASSIDPHAFKGKVEAEIRSAIAILDENQGKNKVAAKDRVNQAKNNIAKLLDIKLSKREKISDDLIKLIKDVLVAKDALEIAKSVSSKAADCLADQRKSFAEMPEYQAVESMKISDLKDSIKDIESEVGELKSEISELKTKNRTASKEKKELIQSVSKRHNDIYRQEKGVLELKVAVEKCGKELHLASKTDLSTADTPRVIFARDQKEVSETLPAARKVSGKANTSMLFFTHDVDQARANGIAADSVVDLNTVVAADFMRDFNIACKDRMVAAMKSSKGTETNSIEHSVEVRRMVACFNSRLATTHSMKLTTSKAGGLFVEFGVFNKSDETLTALSQSTGLKSFAPELSFVDISKGRKACLLTSDTTAKLQAYYDDKCQGSLPGGIGKAVRAHTTDSYAIAM